MGYNLDFTELVKYHNNLLNGSKVFHNFLESFLLNMAERVLVKTKPRTPVDTGALRGAWSLGKIRRNGINIEVEINNPMEYATEIEYGHRIVRNNVEVGWYEGKFMLKSSIDEIKAQIPSRYRLEFENWCNRNNI